MVLGKEIIGEQDLVVGLQFFGIQEFGKRPVEPLVDEIDRQAHSNQHKQGLQGVCPDNGFYPPPEGIDPDEQDREDDSDLEGYFPGIKDELLEHDGHQEEPERGSQNARHKKRKGADLVAHLSESPQQVLVNRCDIEAVIEGHEDKGDDQVTCEVPEYHLHIAEFTAFYPSRDRDEGNARQGGTDHPKGHQVPGRLLSGPEKICIGIVLSGEVGDE